MAVGTGATQQLARPVGTLRDVPCPFLRGPRNRRIGAAWSNKPPPRNLHVTRKSKEGNDRPAGVGGRKLGCAPEQALRGSAPAQRMTPLGSPAADSCGRGARDASLFWRLGRRAQRIATANAGAIRGRAEMVDRGLAEHYIELAGLQETQVETSELTTKHYRFLFSGDPVKRGGVGLALRKEYSDAAMGIQPFSKRLLYVGLKGNRRRRSAES